MEELSEETYCFPIDKDLEVLQSVTEEKLRDFKDDFRHLIYSKYVGRTSTSQNRFSKYSIVDKNLHSSSIIFNNWELMEIENDRWVVGVENISRNNKLILKANFSTGDKWECPEWYHKDFAMGMGAMFNNIFGHASFVSIKDPQNNTESILVHGMNYMIASGIPVIYNKGNSNPGGIIDYTISFLKRLATFSDWNSYKVSNIVQSQ